MLAVERNLSLTPLLPGQVTDPAREKKTALDIVPGVRVNICLRKAHAFNHENDG